MRSSVLVVLAFVAVLLVAAAVNVQAQPALSNCKLQINDTHYLDLSSDSATDKVISGGGNQYTVNLCKAISLQPGTGITSCPLGQTYNCQSNSGTLKTVALTTSPATGTISGNSVRITYSGGEACPNAGTGVYRKHIITFSCGTANPGTLTYQSESPQCTYNFVYTGAVGCPLAGSGGGGGSSSSGLSGGDVFLIIFFVGGFLYVVIGMAYNFQFKQLRGVEMVPNVDFWRGLPGLIKDGCVFTWSSFMSLFEKK